MCLVALACDLRRKKLVNIWEHEMRKCSTGIVLTLAGVAEGVENAFGHQLEPLYRREFPLPAGRGPERVSLGTRRKI